MKKIIAALFAGALVLTGCAQEGSETKEATDLSKLYELSITLKDGREVTCIKYSSYNQGGLSCDWGGAK